jgi:phosphatidylethanolamine-binding protein (PEBP) family uncharacterized protein
MGRNKRHSRKFQKLRQRKLRRPTRRTQRGGGQVGLLDHADAPATTVTGVDFIVRFQPTVKATEFGPTFTTYQTAHEPYPVWTAPTPPAKYLVVCWDPDVKEGKAFLHWLVINCGADIAEGKVIASWYPPSPPPGSGAHRYIIGLMQQKEDIDMQEITDRTNFNPMNFAQTHSLAPVAYRGFRVETPAIFVPEPPAAT